MVPASSAQPLRSYVAFSRHLLSALDYMLKALLGLIGASKSRQNVSRPYPFPLIPKGPDFDGWAGGLSDPSQGSPSPSAGHRPHLPTSDGESRASPGDQHGEATRACWPAGEAAVLLMKGLYRPPSADSCRIIHRPGTGAHSSGARNVRRLGFLILGRHGVHIRKY